MNVGEWLALGALIVAVVGLPTTVWATRRWGTRRRRIRFGYQSTRLIPVIPSLGEPPLQVTYRGIPVPDPHLVELRLQNVGPADIASSDFDAGHPVVIELHCKMFGLVATTHPEATTSTAVGADDAVISFGPALVKRGTRWAVRAIVSGEPQPQLINSLIDTDISDMWPEPRPGIRTWVG